MQSALTTESFSSCYCEQNLAVKFALYSYDDSQASKILLEQSTPSPRSIIPASITYHSYAIKFSSMYGNTKPTLCFHSAQWGCIDTSHKLIFQTFSNFVFKCFIDVNFWAFWCKDIANVWTLYVQTSPNPQFSGTPMIVLDNSLSMLVIINTLFFKTVQLSTKTRMRGLALAFHQFYWSRSLIFLLSLLQFLQIKASLEEVL